MVTIEDLKYTLPNFPEEILRDWLLPYGLTEGWPPAPTFDTIPIGRWKYLLCTKPLKYWRSLHWDFVECHISIHDLDSRSQLIMQDMVLGAVQNQPNLYSNSIPDLKNRFFNIVEFVKANGCLPRPPTLLSQIDKLKILDGNHRMAAYFYCYGYFNLEIEDQLLLGTKEIQSYWIANEHTTECPLLRK